MKLVLIGAGGHAKSCISCIESSNYQISGFLDIPEKVGSFFENYPIIGTDEDFEKLNIKGYGFLLSIGQIESSNQRKKIYNKLKSINARLPQITAKTAMVSNTAVIGQSTIVMQKALVNSSAIIGVNCIINTGAIIEHDCNISDHTHISTGAIINGSCIIGSDCFVGSGSVIKNNLTICNKVIIGAGSVVLHNIVKPGVYAGNPLKYIRDINE